MGAPLQFVYRTAQKENVPKAERENTGEYGRYVMYIIHINDNHRLTHLKKNESKQKLYLSHRIYSWTNIEYNGIQFMYFNVYPKPTINLDYDYQWLYDYQPYSLDSFIDFRENDKILIYFIFGNFWFFVSRKSNKFIVFVVVSIAKQKI